MPLTFDTSGSSIMTAEDMRRKHAIILPTTRTTCATSAHSAQYACVCVNLLFQSLPRIILVHPPTFAYTGQGILAVFQQLEASELDGTRIEPAHFQGWHQAHVGGSAECDGRRDYLGCGVARVILTPMTG